MASRRDVTSFYPMNTPADEPSTSCRAGDEFPALHTVSPHPSPQNDPHRLQKVEYNDARDQTLPIDSPPTMKPSSSVSSDTSSIAITTPEGYQQAQENQNSSRIYSNSVYRALRCGHLHAKVTVEELRDHFLHCPGLKHVYLPLKHDGTAKNYGMVDFDDSENAHKAQKELNGTKLRGKVLSLFLTHPMTRRDVQFSMSADPRALSPEQIFRITSSSRRTKAIANLRLAHARDLKRPSAGRYRANKTQPRVLNLVKLLGVDAVSVAEALDKIVTEIDDNYHDESELRRNSRIWNIQFQYFEEASKQVLSRRVAFTDKHMFKPSPDDEETTKDDRRQLLDWMAGLHENIRKLRTLEKLFNKDLGFEPRKELSCQTKLRHTRDWIIHDSKSNPDFVFDWYEGHNICFIEIDELLPYMREYKDLVQMTYNDKIMIEQFDEPFNHVFIPRDWAVIPLEARRSTHTSSDDIQAGYDNNKQYSEMSTLDDDYVHTEETYAEDGGFEQDMDGQESNIEDLNQLGSESVHHQSRGPESTELARIATEKDLLQEKGSENGEMEDGEIEEGELRE